MNYHIVVHKDPGSSYGVIVLDLPGCFSGGETFEEALSSVKEAIQGHMGVMAMDGYPIPEKRPLDEHEANVDFVEGAWATVSVDVSAISVNPTPSRI